MKKNVRVISLALAALLLVSACFCITGCKKHEVKMTEKNNGLYDYEEVRQINETLRMPYPLGTREAAFGSEFESYGGIPDHAEVFRSKDNLDITYTLSTLELKYGAPDKNAELIATGFTIRAANKTIIRNADGSTTPLYTTDRAMMSESLSTEIERALNTLNGREKEIIEMSYGINHQEMTLEEIGEKFGLTRDPRAKERKKYGLKKARKAPQFSKR